MCAAPRPTKMKDCGRSLLPLSAPHGLIKGVQNEVDYQCQPGSNVQSGQRGMHSVLRV